jgi:hypothetical protein
LRARDIGADAYVPASLVARAVINKNQTQGFNEKFWHGFVCL